MRMRKRWWLAPALALGALLIVLAGVALGLEAVRDDDGDTLRQTSAGEGNPGPLTFDATNRLWIHAASGDAMATDLAAIEVLLTGTQKTKVWDGTNTAGVLATILSLKCDLSSVAGTVTNVNGGNRDAGTQTVTLADDDPAVTDLAALELINTDIETAIQIIDDWDATHDSAAPADGVQMMAAYDSTLPSALSDDADAGRVLCDEFGRLRAGWEVDRWQGSVQSADASSTEAVIKAGTASKKIAVLWLKVHCDVALDVTLEDEDDNVLDVAYCAAKGGYVITFPPEAPLVVNTANKALQVQTSGAGNVSATAGGYLYP